MSLKVAQLERDFSDSKAQLLEASGSQVAAVSELRSNLAEVVESTRELQQQALTLMHASHTAGARLDARAPHTPPAPRGHAVPLYDKTTRHTLASRRTAI